MENISSKTGKNIYTTKEAEELGIQSRYPPPPPQKCIYCGNILYSEGIYFAGMIVVWKGIPPRCGCDKAKAYWKKYDEEMEKRKKGEEQERRQKAFDERVKAVFDKSCLPKRFLSRTFDSFNRTNEVQIKAYSKAIEYNEKFKEFEEIGQGLYICGSFGTGKTHLAVAVGISLLNKGINVIFKTAGDILEDIRKTFDEDYEGINSYAVLDIYRSCELLIIDDLGKEKPTEFSVTSLFSIINSRYENMKPTIITSNFSLDNLPKALTPAKGDISTAQSIASRLRESCDIINMTWDDFRGKPKTNRKTSKKPDKPDTKNERLDDDVGEVSA